MYAFFRPGIGRLRMILAFGLALWAVAEMGGQAIAADNSCGCDDGCNPSGFWSGSEPFPRDPWYVSADGMALQRVFQGLGPAAYSTLTNSVALSQQDLDSPFQSGVRLLVGHTFDDSPYQVEVSYFWLSPWDTSATAVDPSRTGSLFSPFTDFGFFPDNSVDNNNTVSIHQISQLEGGEINLKCLLPLPAGDPSITLMFGARHVAIREEFDYSSLPITSNPVSVHAHTNNDLWGPQIGGIVEYGHQDVWLRVEGKAAICNNSSNRDLDANVGGTDANHPRLTQSNTASVGEISAALRWRPTSALTAQIGYQALWCDQLALASRNFAPDLASLINPAAEPPINTRGTLIYHGPFAGLQLNW